MIEADWVRWLLGALTVAFTAWAGVVYRGLSSLLERANAIHLELSVELAELKGRVESMERDLRKHEDLPAHSDVLQQIKVLEAKVGAITKQPPGGG